MPPIPEHLAENLAAGRVVPFVGAGVSRAVLECTTRKPLFPSWPELLWRCADYIDRQSLDSTELRGLLNREKADLIKAAQAARAVMGPYYLPFLVDALNPHQRQADDPSLALAKKVWQLNSNLVITTNFDRVLEWACPQPAGNWRIEEPEPQRRYFQGMEIEPTVWHLHGSVESPEQMILTTEDFADLYPARGLGAAKYKAALLCLQLVLLGRTVLFIGFSLEDEYVRGQLKFIRDLFSGSIHYALLTKSDEERLQDAPVTVVTFESVGKPLLDRMDELVSHARRRPADDRMTDLTSPIPAPLNNAMRTSIIRLINYLLTEGIDPEKAMKHLDAMQKTGATDDLVQVSTKVASELHADILHKQAFSESLEQEYLRAIKDAQLSLEKLQTARSHIDRMNESLSARFSKNIDRGIENVLARVIREVQSELATNDLYHGRGFLFRPSLRDMASEAVRISMHVVDRKLPEFIREVVEEALRAQIHEYWSDSNAFVAQLLHTVGGGLQVNAELSTLRQVSVDQRFWFERAWDRFEEEHPMMSLLPEYKLLRLIFTALDFLQGRSAQDGIKDKTVEVLRGELSKIGPTIVKHCIVQASEAFTSAARKMDANASALLASYEQDASRQMARFVELLKAAELDAEALKKMEVEVQQIRLALRRSSDPAAGEVYA
jgi:hypothetical protein